VDRCQIRYEYLAYARFQVAVKVKAIRRGVHLRVENRGLAALEGNATTPYVPDTPMIGVHANADFQVHDHRENAGDIGSMSRRPVVPPIESRPVRGALMGANQF